MNEEQIIYIVVSNMMVLMNADLFDCMILYFSFHSLLTDTLELSDLDDEGRITLFERGLAYHKSGKQGRALKYYLTCLRDLSQECRFILLPQCLRNVSMLG